jgi:hypothetical protein
LFKLTAAVAVVVAIPRIVTDPTTRWIVAIAVGFSAMGIVCPRCANLNGAPINRDILIAGASVGIGAAVGWIGTTDPLVVFPFGVFMIVHGVAIAALSRCMNLPA